MQSEKYLAAIMAQGKYNDLHPLSNHYPAGNLPISNKPLIVYHLEQLEKINKDQLAGIIIIYNTQNKKLIEYIQMVFLPHFVQYPHRILFYKASDNQSEIESFQQFIKSQKYQEFGVPKGLMVMPVDLISATPYSEILAFHENSKSDLTLFLKQKKAFGEKDKKPQTDFQPQIDIALLGANNQVISLSDIEDYSFNGFEVGASLYQRISKGSFYQVMDTTFYIMSLKAVRIGQRLDIPDPTTIKYDLISSLIRNQCNTNLLDYASEYERRPLNIAAKLTGENQYIRRIYNTKIYEKINLEGLIRGPKEKQILLPNRYTSPLDPEYNNTYKGCLIGDNSLIDPTCKIKRSVIGNGCKLGKNIQISNSIILGDTIIEDGCNILDSVIGPKCLIRRGSLLVYCQLASGCIVEKQSKRESELILPMVDKI